MEIARITVLYIIDMLGRSCLCMRALRLSCDCHMSLCAWDCGQLCQMPSSCVFANDMIPTYSSIQILLDGAI
jgi:hypothetical protein